MYVAKLPSNKATVLYISTTSGAIYRQLLMVHFTFHINHWIHPGADWKGPPPPQMHLNPYKWNCLLSWKAWARGEGWHRPQQNTPGLIFFLRVEGRVHLDCKPLIFNLGVFWSGLPCLHLWLNHFYLCEFKCKYFHLNFPYFSMLYTNDYLLRKYLSRKACQMKICRSTKNTGNKSHWLKCTSQKTNFNSWVFIFASQKYSCREDRT